MDINSWFQKHLTYFLAACDDCAEDPEFQFDKIVDKLQDQEQKINLEFDKLRQEHRIATEKMNNEIRNATENINNNIDQNFEKIRQEHRKATEKINNRISELGKQLGKKLTDGFSKLEENDKKIVENQVKMILMQKFVVEKMDSLQISLKDLKQEIKLSHLITAYNR